MDALSLLKTDHDNVKQLLKRLEDTSETSVKTRKELFDTIKQEVVAHEMVEEEIFYPSLREYEKTEEIVLHSYEEHHLVDIVLEEMSHLPVDDETWSAKAHVLKENLEHHIEDEETEMFPKARKLLGLQTLDELGNEMAERKDEILASGPLEPSAKPSR